MRRFMALLLVLMLLPAFPVAQGANDARSDTDRGYLSEAWRAGLGNGLGSLNSIRVADIDADGEDEILVGALQGDAFHVPEMGGVLVAHAGEIHAAQSRLREVAG